MGYYMRFFDTEKKRLTLRSLRTALRHHDREYDLDINDPAHPQHGILTYSGVVYAEIDISEPGDGAFEEEIAEMRARVTSVRGKGKASEKQIVQEILGEAKRTVVVCVRFGTKELEETFSRIDPLWDILFSERVGLLHAEGEGFYDEDGLLLAVK